MCTDKKFAPEPEEAEFQLHVWKEAQRIRPTRQSLHGPQLLSQLDGLGDGVPLPLPVMVSWRRHSASVEADDLFYTAHCRDVVQEREETDHEAWLPEGPEWAGTVW